MHATSSKIAGLERERRGEEGRGGERGETRRERRGETRRETRRGISYFPPEEEKELFLGSPAAASGESCSGKEEDFEGKYTALTK